MGLASSSANGVNKSFEQPSEKHEATLYYFEGGGLADQIRWMLAASNISFVQKSVTTRAQFMKMAERQLPFGQLPLLQIDNFEIVQSQAIVRYLAKRGNLLGTCANDELECDMIAETIKDILPLLTKLPSLRKKGNQAELDAHVNLLKEKWMFLALRFEVALKDNKSKSGFIVGSQMTYADILVAHILTWVIEECGSDMVESFPLLVDLQIRVLEMPQMSNFLKSAQWYPLGNDAYVEQVSEILGRQLWK